MVLGFLLECSHRHSENKQLSSLFSSPAQIFRAGLVAGILISGNLERYTFSLMLAPCGICRSGGARAVFIVET